jgi:hypothetical protein
MNLAGQVGTYWVPASEEEFVLPREVVAADLDPVIDRRVSVPGSRSLEMTVREK